MSGYHGMSSPDRLLLGAEFSDGRAGTNIPSGDWQNGDAPVQELFFEPRGSSGGKRGIDTSFLLAPLPLAGTLGFVCPWPDKQIPETDTTFNATEVNRALERQVVRWPEEPELPNEAPPQVPPAVPPAGWFARVLGT